MGLSIKAIGYSIKSCITTILPEGLRFWILDRSRWNDEGEWRDNSTWSDGNQQ